MTGAQFFRTGRYKCWAWITGVRIVVGIVAVLFGLGYLIVLYPEALLLWGGNRLLHEIISAVCLPADPFTDYAAPLFIPFIVADTLAIGYWIERRRE